MRNSDSDMESDDEDVYDGSPRAVVPDRDMRTAEHPISCDSDIWRRTNCAYGLGLYVHNEQVPMVFLSNRGACARNKRWDDDEGVAKCGDKGVRIGWYAAATPGEEFTLRITHFKGRGERMGHDAVYELFIDGANVFGEDAGACSFVSPGLETTEEGFHTASNFREGSEHGTSTIARFRFGRTRVAENSEKVSGHAGTILLKVFHAVKLNKKRRVSLARCVENNRHRGARSVTEKDAAKDGVSICVERGGTRTSETVRRATHTYDYDPSRPVGVITVFLREPFWLESRNIFARNGGAYVPIRDSINLEDEFSVESFETLDEGDENSGNVVMEIGETASKKQRKKKPISEVGGGLSRVKRPRPKKPQTSRGQHNSTTPSIPKQKLRFRKVHDSEDEDDMDLDDFEVPEDMNVTSYDDDDDDPLMWSSVFEESKRFPGSKVENENKYGGSARRRNQMGSTARTHDGRREERLGAESQNRIDGRVDGMGATTRNHANGLSERTKLPPVVSVEIEFDDPLPQEDLAISNGNQVVQDAIGTQREETNTVVDADPSTVKNPVDASSSVVSEKQIVFSTRDQVDPSYGSQSTTTIIAGEKTKVEPKTEDVLEDDEVEIIDEKIVNVKGETDDKLFKELLDWKQVGLVKNTVVEWESAQVARALAAFLLNYEKVHVNTYRQLFVAFEKDFKKKCVLGSSFVDADDDESKKSLIGVAMKPISEVVHGDTVPMLRIRLKSFLRKVQ